MRAYLDHNATSPARPQVIEAVTHAMTVFGNASAQHSNGRAAAKLVSSARESVALAMGVCDQDIVFTSGGTEGDNTAILSAVECGCTRLLMSPMDHPATLMAAESSGAQIELIPVNDSGQTDLEWLKSRLSTWDHNNEGRPFVSIVAANSETGVIQQADVACDIVHDAGGLILVDAVQALGKLPMNFQPDYMSVSAHKIGGPMGIGALYVAPDAPFTAFQLGGGQERRKRAGTLNVAGIAGFGAAAKALLNKNLSGVDHTRDIRDTIETRMKDMEPELIIFGADVPRLPNTSFFAVPDAQSMTLMMGLDLQGVSVSTGMACSSGKTGESRALRAMGQSHHAPKGAIRISLGYNSTPKDGEKFLTAWSHVRRRALKGAA